jgi:hypothetical protein
MGGMAMSQDPIIRARGLFTNGNQNEVPNGALAVADNVILRRPGVLEPRRGIANYGSASHIAKRLTVYRDTLISHSSTGTISYDNGSGTFTAVSGSYPPPNTTTAKTRFAQAAQDLFFTSDAGVYKMDSASATPVLSGPPKSVGFERNARVATAAIGAMSLTSNVVSVTTSAAHGFYVGQVITQTSATEAPYAAGNYTVATAPSSTTFTYALTAGDDPANANAHTFQPAALVTAGGFLSDGNQVAYRVMFDRPDANNASIYGAVSGRYVVANATGTPGWVTTEAKNVVVRVLVPSTVTNKCLVYLYRSAQVSTSVEPSEEVQLVYRALVKDLDISRGWLDITDISTDALRGEASYVNPSQEGLAQNNEPPPLAKDIIEFGGSMHYFNTTGLHRMVVTLLGVGSPNGLQDGDIFYPNEAVGDSLTATTSTPTVVTQFKIESGGSAAQNIRNTALNFVSALNNSGYGYLASYISGADELPGKILIERSSLDDSAFTPAIFTDTAAGRGLRTAWSPLLAAERKAFSLSRTSNVVTATVASGFHNLLAGESVTLTNPSGTFAAGPHIITSVSGSTAFTYAETAANDSVAGKIFTLTRTVSSTNDATPSRVYHSKTNQPEAVPATNHHDVGSKDGEHLRAVALRDSMFAFKEDGLYRGVGGNGQFEWKLFDPTIILLAPDSVAVLGNQIYALTTQGVVAVSDTGSEVVSRDIEKSLIDLQAVSLTKLQQLTFGVARESDRVYELRTITASGDTTPTQAWLFHAAEDVRGWTKDGLSAWCGVQNPTDDKRYLGGTSYVLKERKDFAYTDYSDADLTVDIDVIDTAARTITLLSATGVSVGDVLTQGAAEVRITGIVGTSLSYDSADDAGAAAMTEGAPGTVKTRISSTVQWAPILGGNPGAQKLWQEANFLLGNGHLPAATISFSTELVTTFEEATVDGITTIGQWASAGGTWDGTERPFNLRLMVPQEMRRSSRLNVKWACSSAWAAYNISGLEPAFSVGGQRTSR